jgi:hypothetical protein
MSKKNVAKAYFQGLEKGSKLSPLGESCLPTLRMRTRPPLILYKGSSLRQRLHLPDQSAYFPPLKGETI